MRTIIVILIAVLALAGCQERPTTQAQVPDEKEETARQLVLRSIVDLQNKDLKSAIASLQASIKTDPSQPQAYLLLGQILLKVQEFGHAADFLDQTSKIFPTNGTVFYMLSVADRMAGKRLPAVLAARRSVEIFQDQNDAEDALKAAALLKELLNTPDDHP